jgi:hypothetical protein
METREDLGSLVSSSSGTSTNKGKGRAAVFATRERGSSESNVANNGYDSNGNARTVVSAGASTLITQASDYWMQHKLAGLV